MTETHNVRHECDDVGQGLQVQHILVHSACAHVLQGTCTYNQQSIAGST